MLSKPTNKKRFIYLDAIRGLAALAVVVYHVLGSHWGWMTEVKWANMIFNGSDAVAIFFVLSGLVLTYSFFKKDIDITATYYKRFVISRLFRLYPAFLFMLVIYYLYEYNQVSFLSLWGDTLMHNPHYFWEEAMLMRGHHTLYLPDWTLGIEMAFSLLVPFFFIIAKKGNRLFLLFLLATMVMGKDYISEFSLHFGLGILIAKNYDLVLTYQSDRWWYRWRWWLLPVVLFFFSVRHFLHIHPLPESIKYFTTSILGLTEFVFSGIASALILMYVINSARLRIFFSKRIFAFLGEVSYGVYLSHWLFTRIVMRNFGYWKESLAQNNELIFLVYYLVFTLICSILSGYLIFNFIEKPFIRFGKKMAMRWVK